MNSVRRRNRAEKDYGNGNGDGDDGGGCTECPGALAQFRWHCGWTFALMKHIGPQLKRLNMQQDYQLHNSS